MRFCSFLCAFFLFISTASAKDIHDLFRALAKVESNNNDNAVGDSGASIGRYQIQYVYWKDSGVKGSYKQVKNKAYAEKVMLAYWQKHCPKALKSLDFQTLAKCHNGGPKGYKMKATQKYWNAVQKQLNSK